ncbi:MAG: polysaccharide biosynthesis tyrosine autokinase [Cyanobacteria bacterium P01_F01_bin.42]
MNWSIHSLYARGLSTLSRRFLPAFLVFGSVVGISSVYIFNKTPIYRIEGHVIFEQENKSLSLVGLSSLAKNLAQGGGWGDADLAIETEKRVILSQPILETTLDQLQRTQPQGSFPSVQGLRHQLKTTSVPSTKIIRITLDSQTPERAETSVNELMEVYLRNNLITTRQNYSEAKKFVSAQIPEFRQQVLLSERALSEFKEQNNINSLNTQNQRISSGLSRIDSQIDEAEVALRQLVSDSRNLQQKLGLGVEEALAITKIRQSPTLDANLRKIQSLEQQIAEAIPQYQASHPTIRTLEDQLAEAKTLAQANLSLSASGRIDLDALKSRVGPSYQELISSLIQTEIGIESQLQQKQELSQRRLTYVRRSESLPKLEQKLRELERELEVAETNYQDLNKNLQDLELSEKQTVSNVKILEPAQVSLVPIAPNKKITVTTAVVAGALLALAAVTFLEISDNRINRLAEIRQKFDYPLLGTIPSFKLAGSKSNLKSLPIIEQPHSPFGEGYRILQSNLKFLQSDNPVQVLVMTSSIPQEGKSTTSANLAVAFAQMGNSVLIMDADLRRPSQHQIWEIPNRKGISNILSDSTVHLSSIRQNVVDGVDVITAGVIPPNPLGLLDSQRMKSLVHEVSSQYDLVIIDAPPLGVATDAIVLGQSADGIVLVARPGIVTRNSANFSQEVLQRAEMNILGLVINGGKSDKESDSHYYYYANPYYNT